jgi:hypothetical protein
MYVVVRIVKAIKTMGNNKMYNIYGTKKIANSSAKRDWRCSIKEPTCMKYTSYTRETTSTNFRRFRVDSRRIFRTKLLYTATTTTRRRNVILSSSPQCVVVTLVCLSRENMFIGETIPSGASRINVIEGPLSSSSSQISRLRVL